MIDLTPRAEQALAADSPVSGFFGKVRGRATEAQRSALLVTNIEMNDEKDPYNIISLVAAGSGIRTGEANTSVQASRFYSRYCHRRYGCTC
jgi:hypothetical protein